MQLRSAANLSGVFLESGFEGGSAEINSRQAAGIQLGGHFIAVDPRCSEKLERTRGAAAFGDVRSLQQTHARINHRGVRRRHVGRGHDPRKSCLLVVVRAIPTFERQDGEIDVRHQLITELLRQFAYCFSVAHGQGMKPDKREMVGLLRPTLCGQSVDGIRTISHDDGNPVPCRRLHAKQHGPDEGVVTRPHIDEIDEEHLETCEHLVRRFPVFAVKTVHRNSEKRMTVSAPLDHVVLRCCFEAVLRTEQRREFDFARGIHRFEGCKGRTQRGIGRGGVEEGPGAAAAQAGGPKFGEPIDRQDDAAHCFTRAMMSAVMSSAPGASMTCGSPLAEAADLSRTRA